LFRPHDILRKMSSSKFDSLYKNLNSEQKQAVDTIDGPVIVIAGPGTGKTSILTLRIANILRKTDTAPESILSLTFTESGVHSMRKKIVDTVGAAGFRVPIHTFHSFCNDVIKSFPQEFPRIIGAQHVTDIDQISVLENLLMETKLTLLKPTGNPVFYLKPVLSFIKELKREDVSPKEYAKHVETFEKDLEDIEDLRHEKGAYKGEIKAKYKPAIRKIENSKEFAVLYEKYEVELNEKRLYDYEDMIIEVLRALRENKDLLLELQETYQYILADEHQDANRGQNRLLELLSGFHEQPNLFVVGDEKQAIFRFQGASLENFLYFKRRFKDAKVISLTKNYRSTQGILDASHGLIENNTTGGDARVRLESKNPERNPDLFVTECDSPRSEANFVAKKILEKIKSGVSPEQIAVLFRDNKDAEDIARAFDMYGIPCVLHTDVNVIADEYIQKLLYVLRTTNDFGDEKYLAPLLFLDLFKLNHLDVFKVIRRGRDARKNLIDVMKSDHELSVAGVEEPKRFIELYHLLHELSSIGKNRSLIDAFQEIVSKTGYIGFLLSKPRSLELITAYDALLIHMVGLMERHKNVKIADYLDLLNKMSVHDVTVRAKSVSTYPGRVNLLTAHKSKGLEFDYVYCLHLNDGRWGGRRSSSHFLPITASSAEGLESDVSDERRLLYVVITRARKEVSLTYATHREGGKELLPSRFIEEIDTTLIQRGESEAKETVIYPRAIETPVTHELDLKNKKYLNELFLEQGFSVSAFNNYLTCPWRYFFLNLLRIPRAEERHQLYGTAIHETLRVFFDAYKIEKKMMKKDFLDFFEKFLNRKALSGHDYELFLDRGRKALGGYFDVYNGLWPKNIFNEYSVSGVQVPVEYEGEQKNILLRGQLDKVELLDDGSVNVVDYKTGNPKSRRDIEGETQSSEGNYKRQLIFYKILLDKHQKAQFSMKTGEIDFVEPNKQGKYKKERFDVTDQEVEELTKEIKRVSLEILDMAFWNKTCEDAECEFCALKNLFIVD